MRSFIVAFNVICPLFLMMALGYLLTRVHIFTEGFLKQLNNVCFKVFLPCILFVNMYHSDFSKAFQPDLVVFSILSVLAMFLILLFVVVKVQKNNYRRGVFIQGMFRSNYVLFGIPIATNLFGADNVGTTAILIAFVVPLFNILSVLVLELFNGSKMDIKQMLKGIVKNPLIIAACIAFFFILSELKIPNVLMNTIGDIADIATPLALIILGGSFSFKGLKKNMKAVAILVFTKLFLFPTIFMSISIALGFRGVALGALLALFCSPTAVSSFTMAQQMNADDELAGQIVVVSSLFSMISIFMWIMLCRTFLMI